MAKTSKTNTPWLRKLKWSSGWAMTLRAMRMGSNDCGVWGLTSALKVVWERAPAPPIMPSSASPAGHLLHSPGFRRNLAETQKSVPDFAPRPAFPPSKNLTEFSWAVSETGVVLSVHMGICLQSTACQHPKVKQKCMTRTSAEGHYTE